MQELPLPVHVHAAAILIGVAVRLILALWEVQKLIIVGRLIGMRRYRRRAFDQQSARFQRAVADHLGGQAERRLPREEPILWIALLQLLRGER